MFVQLCACLVGLVWLINLLLIDGWVVCLSAGWCLALLSAMCCVRWLRDGQWFVMAVV